MKMKTQAEEVAVALNTYNVELSVQLYATDMLIQMGFEPQQVQPCVVEDTAQLVIRLREGPKMVDFLIADLKVGATGVEPEPQAILGAMRHLTKWISWADNFSTIVPLNRLFNADRDHMEIMHEVLVATLKTAGIRVPRPNGYIRAPAFPNGAVDGRC